MNHELREIGVVVFVKTPGLSMPKTRLAAGIGDRAAIEFYQKSCWAIKSVVEGGFDPNIKVKGYWAVNEDISEPVRDFWPSWDLIEQGTGGLADRLDRVYREVLARHGEAILLGADCPQITAAEFGLSASLMDTHGCCVGPAKDGGFYWFHGRVDIEQEVWARVNYSSETTLAQLQMNLANAGVETASLPMRFDVDLVGDLIELQEYMSKINDLTKGQASLLSWIRGLALLR